MKDRRGAGIPAHRWLPGFRATSRRARRRPARPGGGGGCCPSALATSVFLLAGPIRGAAVEELSSTRFLERVDAGRVREVEIHPDGHGRGR